MQLGNPAYKGISLLVKIEKGKKGHPLFPIENFWVSHFLVTAKPPMNLHGHHYGPTLQAYILHQYYGCGVTQPRLLEWLWDIGLSISPGELSNLITKGHGQFHSQKDEILVTGLRCSSYIQTDDTGARHQGQHGYCTIICNESFAWYATTV